MDVQKAVDDFLFYLEVEKNYSPNTLRSYAFDLHCFCSFLHKQQRSVELKSLDITTARRFIQDQVLSYGIKPRTLQRRISCLKSFSHYCVREKWLDIDFMSGVDSPKTDKRLPVYMKLEELRMLFRKLECEEHDFAIRNELMFKFLATTGMRRQELVDLNWEHIDFGTNTVRVMGKRNKERLLPLHASVIPLFISYQKSLRPDQLHPSEPVFLNRFGQRIDPRGLHRIFKDVLKRVGLPPTRFSLHHLRHTFATLLLHNKKEGFDKVDLRTLQELLGHENLATVSVYTHVDFENKKKAIDSFEI